MRGRVVSGISAGPPDSLSAARASGRRSPSGLAAMPWRWCRTRSSVTIPAGRDEMFSAYFSEIVIENEAGKALAIDRLKVDGQAFRDSCPGISGRFQAQGTMIVAGLDLASRAVADELHKIRLDRDVAVDRLLASAEICRHVGQGARCGRGGTEAGSASGVVRGTACVERLAAGRTQKIECCAASTSRQLVRVHHGRHRLSTVQFSPNTKSSTASYSRHRK